MSEIVDRLEVRTAASILKAMAQDIQDIDRYWPASKRGSNANRAFNSLLDRRDAALQCLSDALPEPSP